MTTRFLVGVLVYSMLVTLGRGELFTILSDAGDGSIAVLQSGGFQASAGFQDERVGLQGDEPNREKINAIYFFSLPEIGTQQIVDATFSFPLENITTSSLTFNLDVWGLGFEPTATLDTAWLNFSQTDRNSGLGISERVLITDDLLTPSSFDPDGTEVTLPTSSVNLVSFLNDLYDSGAESGTAFAVIRLSMDSDPDFSIGTPGYVVGFSEFNGLDPQLSFTAIPEPSTITFMIVLIAFLGYVANTKKRISKV